MNRIALVLYGGLAVLACVALSHAFPAGPPAKSVIDDPGQRIRAACVSQYAPDTDAVQGCQIALLANHLARMDHDRAAAAQRDAGE